MRWQALYFDILLLCIFCWSDVLFFPDSMDLSEGVAGLQDTKAGVPMQVCLILRIEYSTGEMWNRTTFSDSFYLYSFNRYCTVVSPLILYFTILLLRCEIVDDGQAPEFRLTPGRSTLLDLHFLLPLLFMPKLFKTSLMFHLLIQSFIFWEGNKHWHLRAEIPSWLDHDHYEWGFYSFQYVL